MIKKFSLPVLFMICLVGVGCEKKAETTTISVEPPPRLDVAPPAATETMETKALGMSIDTYVSSPTAENAADVKKAFAKLDGEIAELEERVAKTTGADMREAQAKLTNMQAYRAKETARYTAATAVAPITTTMEPVDTRTGAEKVESTLRKTGDKIENAAEKVGDKIKDATDN